MKTVGLHPQISEALSPYHEPRTVSESAQLHAEIAERLLEWSEKKTRGHVARWLLRVTDLVRDAESSEAFWLYLRLSTGDLSQLTSSFSEQGEGRSRSKQAQHQEQARALRVIARHFPEVARQIDALQGRGAPP